MKEIASFTINHLKLLPGIYVSRKDAIGSEMVTTFDIRMTRPNFEPVMNTADIVPLITSLFEFIRDFEGQVPGAAAFNCGNYLDMNLPMAKYLAKHFLDTILYNIDDTHLIYPEA